MTELRFTVLGKPQPAGSKRAFAIRKGGVPTGQIAVVDANKNAKPWQQEVKATAREQFPATFGLLDGPLSVSMIFYAQRPKGHYGTGRNADALKPSAPQFPTGRPDALKLARGTEDALTGVVYRDDAQVVNLTVAKRYGVPERCEIVVTLADEAAPACVYCGQAQGHSPRCSVTKFGAPEHRSEAA